MEDRDYMRLALDLARDHARAGHGGPFGALVVVEGRVVGEGWNQVTSTNDPTAHAEMVAIREACRHLNRFHLVGGFIYTSCEPCPMCLAACYWARLERIVFAAERVDAAEIGFTDEFLYREIPRDRSDRSLVMSQLLRPEAVKIMHDWHADPNRIGY